MSFCFNGFFKRAFTTNSPTIPRFRIRSLSPHPHSALVHIRQINKEKTLLLKLSSMIHHSFLCLLLVLLNYSSANIESDKMPVEQWKAYKVR
jgi:hypothetical protein